jgi:hypothetical protein
MSWTFLCLSAKDLFFNEEEKKSLLSSAYVSAHPNEYAGLVPQQFQSQPGVPFPEILMAVDMETYLPDDLVVKADIGSMSCSLEARSRFWITKSWNFAPPSLVPKTQKR